MPEYGAMERIRNTTAEWLRTLYPPADLDRFRADLQSVLDDLDPQARSRCCRSILGTGLTASTPEPPIGSRVMTHGGHSWTRAAEGHWIEVESDGVAHPGSPLTWAQVVDASTPTCFGAGCGGGA